ncbi:MAG: DCC1-like thiol-disulfide oxidoreductase family protein, partial [Acidobacteriota bacterium]
GLPKMLDPVWRQGDGFYLAMLLPWTHHPWADRIAGSRALTLISNYLGIATETGFVFLIFVPYLRWVGVALFIGLTAGFGILMSFYFIGAAGISFLPLLLPDSQGRWPWRPRLPPLKLLYDGECGFCDQSVRILQTFDVWNRVRPLAIQEAMPLLAAHHVPADAALDQMHIVEGDRIVHGFRAFRRFAWVTPYFLPIAPLLYVPGVPQLGQLIYAAIAKRRYRISCAIGGPRGLRSMTPPAARPPTILARLFATSHLAYVLIFAVASVRAVFGAPHSLERLSEVRVIHEYNSFTNDIRPLPLFCEMHLFGVFVYRIQGTTDTGDSVELLPVFDEHGRPGRCCAAGPRYLEGLIFHVTDDAIGRATSHWYVPEVGHLVTYRAVMERAARAAPEKVRSVRMLIKVLNPPRRFEGRVAPWDAERWVPWLQYQIRDGRVVDGEWLETPPMPAYTVR